MKEILVLSQSEASRVENQCVEVGLMGVVDAVVFDLLSLQTICCGLNSTWACQLLAGPCCPLSKDD